MGYSAESLLDEGIFACYKLFQHNFSFEILNIFKMKMPEYK